MSDATTDNRRQRFKELEPCDQCPSPKLCGIPRPCDKRQIEKLKAENERLQAKSRRLNKIIAHQKDELFALQAENERHQEIFSWLLGERGEFPVSEPGKRYGFRSELRRRLQALKQEVDDE